MELHQQSGSVSDLRRCMLFGCAAIYMARLSVPLAAPQMAAEFSWDDVMLGYVLAFFFWGYAITQIPGGRLADRFGGLNVVLIASLAGSGCLMMFPPLVSLYPQSAVALRFILGIVQGVHYPAVSSLTVQLVPEAGRVGFFGTLCGGAPLGSLVSGLVGSLLLERCGWRTLLTLCSMLYLLFSVWLLRLSRRRFFTSESPEKQSCPALPWRLLVGKPQIWAYIWAHMCYASSWFMLISWMPTYFERVHPDAAGWLVNTLPYLVNAVGTLSAPGLAAALTARHVSTTATRSLMELICHLGLALSLLSLPHVYSWQCAVLCLCVGVLSSSLHRSAGLVLPQDMAPQHAGSIMGVANTAGAMAGFAGSLCAGYVVDSLGSYNAVFYINSALSASAALVFVMFASADRIV